MYIRVALIRGEQNFKFEGILTGTPILVPLDVKTFHNFWRIL